jgi:hypothetical protein
MYGHAYFIGRPRSTPSFPFRRNVGPECTRDQRKWVPSCDGPGGTGVIGPSRRRNVCVWTDATDQMKTSALRFYSDDDDVLKMMISPVGVKRHLPTAGRRRRMNNNDDRRSITNHRNMRIISPPWRRRPPWWNRPQDQYLLRGRQLWREESITSSPYPTRKRWQLAWLRR